MPLSKDFFECDDSVECDDDCRNRVFLLFLLLAVVLLLLRNFDLDFAMVWVGFL